MFGQPWSSSDWWNQSNDAADDWQQSHQGSSSWWGSKSYQWRDQSQWQVREEDEADDSQAASSHGLRPAEWLAAPVTPPWKKPQSEDEQMQPADEPPHPWKLLGATEKEEKVEKVETKSEQLSSSSNSEDWGRAWKSTGHHSKHTKELSGESIVMDQPHLKDDTEVADVEMVARSGIHVYPAVGIDWHNVLEVRGNVDEASLEKLIQHGVECTICSYCFKNTAAKVIRRANEMRCSLDLKRIEITEERTGEGGKCDLYEKWCIDVLFDDAVDICKEGLEKGLHVYPICTYYNRHDWFRELGYEPYATFADAVHDFLQTYGPGGKN